MKKRHWVSDVFAGMCLYGEIAWSPEPHQGSDFTNGNAAEVLRNTTCGREASQFFHGSDKLSVEVSEGVVQLQDSRVSGAPLTTFGG